MPMNIANYYEAPRYSAKAGETITLGMVVKISDWGDGEQKLLKLANGDSALLVAGKYGVAFKVSSDPYQVDQSTVPSFMGDRHVTISSGDNIINIGRGAIIEYTADLLDASLDPSRSGTTPVVGQDLGIVGSQWCNTSAGSAITSPIVARVFKVFGTNVLVQLV